MNLLNLKVKHKVFGNGVVTGISDNLLTIQFASKVSNFVYPDAFETFIVVEDTSVQSEILSEIENNKRAVRKQRLAEETARKAEKELRVTERNGTPSRRIRNNIEDGFVYHDHWTTDGDYIYSGEGKTGDQTMSLGNKAIVDAENDGKKIHLFVKFSPQEYYYQGVFSLVDYTYEDDKDESGNMRKEYKFRLRKQSVEE